MSKKRSSSSQRSSLSQGTVTVITALIGVIGSIVVAYFAYQGIVTPKQLEISATQTAESVRETQTASLLSVVPTETLIILPSEVPLTESVFVLALQTDPTDDWISPSSRPSYMDIIEVRIAKVNADNIQFKMQLNQSIPASFKEAHFYGWFLDTDLNSNTGLSYNDIGSDYNVQIKYYPDRGWIGKIFDIEKNSAVEIESIEVKDNMVSMTIPVVAIGSPDKFNWISIDQDNEPFYSDKVPNDGHIHTEIPSP